MEDLYHKNLSGFLQTLETKWKMEENKKNERLLHLFQIFLTYYFLKIFILGLKNHTSSKKSITVDAKTSMMPVIINMTIFFLNLGNSV